MSFRRSSSTASREQFRNGNPERAMLTTVQQCQITTGLWGAGRGALREKVGAQTRRRDALNCRNSALTTNVDGVRV